MKAISFKLSGKTAHFRKPDVNSYFYVTYNNIHKIALYGILGAILGYKGYNSLAFKKSAIENEIKTTNDNQEKIKLKKELKELNQKLPEFYERLQNLKISIIPLGKYGYFGKKIQAFNNSVGYASKEQGGNLIVREQWLENPAWEILILDDESIVYNNLKNSLFEKKSVYPPYLGKNDHPAKIDDVKEIVMTNELIETDGEYYINSLFYQKTEKFGLHNENDDLPYFFQEYSPVKLQNDFGFYEYLKLTFTNYAVENIPENTYSYDNKNYSFI